MPQRNANLVRPVKRGFRNRGIDPSPAEIRQLCEAIRQTWTESDLQNRIVTHNPAAVTPVVATQD